MTIYFRSLLLLGLSTALINCASQQVYIPMQATEPEAKKRTEVTRYLASDSSAINVDYYGIQKELGMVRSADTLGFEEKKFNTCEIGYGYSPTKDCQTQYFTVLQFQLLCRDTEGTISHTVTSAQMQPLSNRNIRWQMNGTNGDLLTDSYGYGQIITVSKKTQTKNYIKMISNNDFLYTKLNEIRRIVTPSPWCY